MGSERQVRQLAETLVRHSVKAKKGEITWDLHLKPAQSTVLGLSFTVEYPADKEIYGL